MGKHAAHQDGDDGDQYDDNVNVSTNPQDEQHQTKKNRKRKKPYQSVSERQASKEAKANGDVVKTYQISTVEKSVASILRSVIPKRLQPNLKGYGGMGYAKPSAWIDLRDDEFMEKYLTLYEEHVEGFSGKAFQKARRRELSQDMLWRVKLREKQAQTQVLTSTSAPSTSTSTKSKSKTKSKKNNKSDMDIYKVALTHSGGAILNQSRLGNTQQRTPMRVPIGGVEATKKSKSKKWETANAGNRTNIKTVGVDTETRQLAIDAYRSQQRLKKQKLIQSRKK
eukprot:m.167214 g.167214  ORF g.167214 m.167214 type:complete len:281 (+) comp31459_c0_seq1:230-1072(+)